MNISFNTQNPYGSFFQKSPALGQGTQNRSAGSAMSSMAGNNDSSSPLSKFTNKFNDDKTSISQQMRQMKLLPG